MKRISLLCALLSSAALFASNYDRGEGPDAQVFLEPYIKSELSQVSGHMVLDCGAATWSLVAETNGAAVCTVESPEGAVKLPYEAHKFDQALSLHIGCHVEKSIGEHFQEMARVMKEGGRLCVTAPASLGVVFTDGKSTESEVMSHINQVLAKIGSTQDSEKIIASLKELEEVQRATFVRRGERLALVTNEKNLALGEQIWRKIPGDVVSNYYHSEEEYLVAFYNAGLFCEEIKRPCFFGAVKYKAFRAVNDSLGEAYKDNNPFTIYYVTKKV